MAILADQGLVYLLGFTQTSSSAQHALQEQDSSLVMSHVVEDITCWFTIIEHGLLDGPGSENNLQDLEWLTPRILMHEAAVSRLAEQSPMFPAQFGVVFSDISVLSSAVTRWRPRLSSFFSEIGDRREWGLKTFVNFDALRTRMERLDIGDDLNQAAGANYLRLRQRQRQINQEMSDLVDKLYLTIAQCLAIRSIRFVKRGTAMHSSELEGFEPILNLALLSKHDEIDEVEEEIARCCGIVAFGDCLQWRLSGPWAPYSFCPPLD